MNELIVLLEAFVTGTDRTVQWAKATEAVVDEMAVDGDPRFEELRDHLASYRPGGGDYLYGEDDMLRICKSSLDVFLDADNKGNEGSKGESH